ncbi:MAG: hypothetical protein KBT01_01530 [Clostridiales bacterium]|nr:hypothetical protein [Candidatus Blautia equi]
MRKYVIHGMKLVYGFLILSGFYCLVYSMILRQSQTAFLYSLLFLPVLLACSIAMRKAGSVVKYVCFAIVILAVMVMIYRALHFSVMDINIGLVVTVFSVFWYFHARASRQKCWLESPTYWFLLFFIIVCIAGRYYEDLFLVKLSCFAAGYTYLLVNIVRNDDEMKGIFRDFSSMNRLPVQRMKRNNNRIMLVLSGITAAAMAAAPYLKLDQLIIWLTKLARKLLIFVFSFFQSGNTETVEIPANEKMDLMFPEVPEQDSIFMKILDMILEYVGEILVGILLLAAAYLIVKRLIQLYRQFNQGLDENGDMVEDLRVTTKTTERVKEQQEKENLFFNMSPAARIRKHFKGQIQKAYRMKGEEIRKSGTPEELEQQLTMSPEDKLRFHSYYEKARYSHETCTREEMQEMLKL